MKIDCALPNALRDIGARAPILESEGYDALWATETRHEPFLQALQAANSTQQVTIGTAIAVAFARSPMTVASSAIDLAEYARGRFILGIGSQVKSHIERRFSMPWSNPAARMREFVLALRAIWSSWEDGTTLSFEGAFYTHTLMTPFFSPPRHEFGAPPVYLAGVGNQMTEVAGEVCDGLLLHAFTTRAYLEQVTVPALRRGRERGGRGGLDDFTIAGMCMVCPGRDEVELQDSIRATKKQIAFYASTPAYRSVLDIHGWGDLQPELTQLSKAGRWDDMADAIDDEILHAIAVVGEPAVVGEGLRQRWGDLIDRTTLYSSHPLPSEVQLEIAEHARAVPSPA